MTQLEKVISLAIHIFVSFLCLIEINCGGCQWKYFYPCLLRNALAYRTISSMTQLEKVISLVIHIFAFLCFIEITCRGCQWKYFSSLLADKCSSLPCSIIHDEARKSYTWSFTSLFHSYTLLK